MILLQSKNWLFSYRATAAELDRRGVNIDSIQQKTADVSQSLKDYGTVGQARAGEYLQQAVDQVGPWSRTYIANLPIRVIVWTQWSCSEAASFIPSGTAVCMSC